MANFREASRATWTSNNTTEDINAGSLQRIADATELMAQRHTELMASRDAYKGWFEAEFANRRSVERQLSAAKGQITKLKKQLAAAKAGNHG